jgi:hypothetical protein
MWALALAGAALGLVLNAREERVTRDEEPAEVAG